MRYQVRLSGCAHRTVSLGKRSQLDMLLLFPSLSVILVVQWLSLVGASGVLSYTCSLCHALYLSPPLSVLLLHAPVVVLVSVFASSPGAALSG